MTVPIFCGWQKQASAVTVQQVLEQALQNFSGEVINLHVAGRTDAGVHACAQVAHMDLVKDVEAGVIRNALNFLCSSASCQCQKC